MVTFMVVSLLFLLASLIMALPWWLLVRVGEYQRRQASPAEQAAFYLSSLVVPVLLLALLLFLTMGPWDADFCEKLHQTCINHLRALHLPLPLDLVLVGLPLLVLIRLGLMLRPNRRPTAGETIPAELAAKWDRVAACLADLTGRAVPRLTLIDHPDAVCFVQGSYSPRLVISRQLLAILDEDELSGAIAHELAHLRRYDLLSGYLAAACHHLLFFLPVSRYCYRRWREEREKACDDLAVHWTGHRLALASALVKVAQMAQRQPQAALACHLLTPGGSFTLRVERLLDPAAFALAPSAARYPWGLIVIGAFLSSQLSLNYSAWHHHLELASVWLLSCIGAVS